MPARFWCRVLRGVWLEVLAQRVEVWASCRVGLRQRALGRRYGYGGPFYASGASAFGHCADPVRQP